MSALTVACEQLVREASPGLEDAASRWAAVILVGYAEHEARDLNDVADLTADEATSIGTPVSWIVVDTATGERRPGGAPQWSAALQKLRDHYAPDPDAGHDAPDWSGERFVLVSQDMASQRYRLVEVRDAALAFRLAGEDVLEGWIPLGLFDLALGRMTELHIATPVVTPAEDQGITTNPLEA